METSESKVLVRTPNFGDGERAREIQWQYYCDSITVPTANGQITYLLLNIYLQEKIVGLLFAGGVFCCGMDANRQSERTRWKIENEKSFLMTRSQAWSLVCRPIMAIESIYLGPDLHLSPYRSLIGDQCHWPSFSIYLTMVSLRNRSEKRESKFG